MAPSWPANSSNSNRLCEIGREEGLPSYLIADASAIAQYAFIRKPFRPSTLVQAVRKMLTGEDESA